MVNIKAILAEIAQSLDLNIITGPKPSYDHFGVGINIFHQADLMVSFLNVLLINTYVVDPEIPEF